MNPRYVFQTSTPLELIQAFHSALLRSVHGIMWLKVFGAPETQSTWHPGDIGSDLFLLFSIHKALGEKSFRICWKNRSFHPHTSLHFPKIFLPRTKEVARRSTRKAGIWDMCLVNKQESAGQKVITDGKIKTLFSLLFSRHCLPINSKRVLKNTTKATLSLN